ncbi:flagellin [Agrobacterium tomkonis]|uniref:flagellin N-terminal helical domain-containing protein n=1 Tax=Agrobacterium tomkonis TaxID=1183410 RepID=UPI001CD8B03C|nr:flagellin [Agrobacterium sp. MS2]
MDFDGYMTSILTNTSAMAALQTLRSIGSQLTQTQGHVSTGLRVQSASDNAAYWSISTTMRSDAMAISAVSDALGLGAAKVDVAYAGTESIVDILTEFKARLVAAKEDGVDKAKIQEELKQLNAQAESIVNAASFSGENWLATSAPTHLSLVSDISTSVVSSFVRSGSGAVSVKTMSVDLKTTSMLNTEGGGILQKDIDNIRDIGGFADANYNAFAHNGHETHVFTGPATFTSTDYVEFSVVVDAVDTDPGVTFTNLRLDKTVVDAALGTTDGTINNAVEMRAVLQKVFTDNGVPLWTVPSGAYTQFSSSTDLSIYEIGSLETSGHDGSSVDILSVTSYFNGVHPAGFALGLEDPPNQNHDNMFPKATMSFTEPFTISGLTEITFDVQVAGGSTQPITVTKATVDAALGTTDGHVADMDAFANVFAYALAGTGLTAISNDPEYPGLVVFRADPTMYPEAGNKAVSFSIHNVEYTPWVLRFDLAEIDVTTDAFTVDDYIEGVEYMLQTSISSASFLGSLQMRIDLQTDFASRLSDSIDKGIGRLVDADMNEASTRLKALQTQEQLAIQSLQIANGNAENILQLFR